MKVSTKKVSRYLTIFVMVAFIVVPVSVSGQNGTNSTIIPNTTDTVLESLTTTQVPVEATTTVPVTNTTTTAPANTTLIPNTTGVTVNETTVATINGTTEPTPVTDATTVAQVSSGTITAASSPLGASILIDGVYYGTTPVNLTGIPSGNHIVRLTLSGYYDYEGTTYVLPGQVTNVFGTLPPLAGAALVSPDVTAAPVTPEATVQPTQTSSTGPLDNPAVIAAVIGTVTACIGAGATIFTHYAKMKKE